MKISKDKDDIVLSNGRPPGMPKLDKKPIIIVCIADKNNIPYARTMITSLRHFHKDWPILLVTDETEPGKLPKDIIRRDLLNYSQDKMFFYRATPIVGESLLDEYELVLKIDADSLVLGDLSYILETKDYDIGTVINWNRFDEKLFPLVQGWAIYPAEYFNCGFVAMRSKKFVHEWKMLCFTPQFDRLQYKEQDLLNALCYFGNYNVRCFDIGNPKSKLNSWFGMIGKGEWNRATVKNGKIIVPQGFGNTPFPPSDMEIKIAHMGGGAGAKKDNWAAFFSKEAMVRIAELIK